MGISGVSGLRYDGHAITRGAQTERRGGVGPVRGLLGGKDRTGRDVRVHKTVNASCEARLDPNLQGQTATRRRPLQAGEPLAAYAAWLRIAGRS
jgi:hypothetical protein